MFILHRERRRGSADSGVEAESWQHLGHMWPADILCWSCSIFALVFCRQKQGGAGQASPFRQAGMLFSAHSVHTCPKHPFVLSACFLRL